MPTRDVNRRQFLADVAATTFAVSTMYTSTHTRSLFADENRKRFPVGIYTRPWANFEYRIALDAIAEAGFSNVGLMTQSSGDERLVISVKSTLEDVAAVNQEVKQRDLKVLSIWAGDFGAAKPLKEAIAGLRHQVDCCDAVDCPSLLLGGTSRREHHDTYYAAVKEVCDYAAEKGVRFDLKPHGGTNATGPQCRSTIEKVGHANLRLWYDPGNIFFYSNGELDPLDDAPLVASIVSGMCIKDFQMKQVDGESVRDVMLTPGDGLVDFSGVLERLVRGGFTNGPLIIECLAAGDRPFLQQQAKRAKRFVDSLVAQHE